VNLPVFSKFRVVDSPSSPFFFFSFSFAGDQRPGEFRQGPPRRFQELRDDEGAREEGTHERPERGAAPGGGAAPRGDEEETRRTPQSEPPCKTEAGVHSSRAGEEEPVLLWSDPCVCVCVCVQGSEDQLKEVWQETDGMDPDQFDPKTFFRMHGNQKERKIISLRVFETTTKRHGGHRMRLGDYL